MPPLNSLSSGFSGKEFPIIRTSTSALATLVFYFISAAAHTPQQRLNSAASVIRASALASQISSMTKHESDYLGATHFLALLRRAWIGQLCGHGMLFDKFVQFATKRRQVVFPGMKLSFGFKLWVLVEHVLEQRLAHA